MWGGTEAAPVSMESNGLYASPQAPAEMGVCSQAGSGGEVQCTPSSGMPGVNSAPEPPGGGEGSQWISKQRSLRVVYVLIDSMKSAMGGSPESGALQCLHRACESEGAQLTSVNFGELDFGETEVLDTFYDAGKTPDLHGYETLTCFTFFFV